MLGIFSAIVEFSLYGVMVRFSDRVIHTLMRRYPDDEPESDSTRDRRHIARAEAIGRTGYGKHDK